MKTISRRRFIEDSLFASFSTCAAATLANASFTTASFAQAASAQKSVSPNDRLGVVIVGGGHRAAVLAHFFGKDKRTKVLYICDPDLGRAKARCAEIEKKYGYAPEAIADFRKALDDKSVDILANASSNHWHALSAIWGLQNGKHCYIEKPLTHNLHEGKAIVAAAKKYGLVFQAGTQARSTTNVDEAMQYIRSGKIGKINFVRGVVYNRRKPIGPLGEYPVPQGIDYDFWSGPAQVKPMTRRGFHYDWHWQRYYGNGDLGNQGSHQFDVARWFLGVDRFPNTVLTYGGRLGYEIEMKDPNYRDAGDVANTSVSIFDYGDKSMVFEVRGLPTTPYRLLGESSAGLKIGAIAYGSDGYVVQGGVEYEKPTGRVAFSLSYAFDKNGKLIQEFKSVGANGKIMSEFDSTERHVVNFIDAVVAGDPKMAVTDARCGELSVALVHLSNMSYYLGENDKVSVDKLKQTLQSVKSLDDNEATLARTVEHFKANGVDLAKTPMSLGATLKLDVEKEIFIDNPAATAMMTRDYRAPYVVPGPENV